MMARPAKFCGGHQGVSWFSIHGEFPQACNAASKSASALLEKLNLANSRFN